MQSRRYHSGIIKNLPDLMTSELRQTALEIIQAGIQSVLPDVILRTSLTFDPRQSTLSVRDSSYEITGRMFVLGGGKAAGIMAQALEEIMGPEMIAGGIVVDKAPPEEFHTRKIRVLQAGHPLPDKRGVAAVESMLALKQSFNLTEKDTVIVLVSGGGSALLPCPLPGLTLESKQETTRLLLHCGADIREVNIVRKHLSRIKGGSFARHFSPARVIALILSDVIGNDLSVIASGLTCADTSTFAEALSVLEKYNLVDRVPREAVIALLKGLRGEIAETPKTLDNAYNHIVGDIQIALEAMHAKARELGLRPSIVTAQQQGETSTVAALRAQEIIRGKYGAFNALLIGGETTPCLPPNPGKGGRNQHYAACTLREMQSFSGSWVLVSMGSDGSDFIPEVAGAIVEDTTLDSLRRKTPLVEGYIERCDSYHLLELAGNSLIITESTHTNVGDMILYLLAD